MTESKTVQTLATNLKMLMELREWSPAKLSERSGVSKRMIAYILKAESKATIETAQALAEPFGLEGWHLIMPNLDRDLAENGTIRKLVDNYMKANKEGRNMISMVAERESKYGN